MNPRFSPTSLLLLTLLFFTASVATTQAGCGSAGGAPDPPPQPQTSDTFTHDTRTVVKTCYHTGNCLRYAFKWPKNTSVTVELTAKDFASVLISDHARVEKRFESSKGGVTRLSFVSTGRTVRLLVAAKNGRGGETALTVSPAPSEIRSQPQPPPTAADVAAKKAARKAEIEAQSKADYDKVTDGQKRKKVSGTFAELAPFSFKLAAGECYTVVIVRSLVGRPAASARIAAKWKGMSYGVGVGGRSDSLVASSKRFCPTSKGRAELTWQDVPKGDPSGAYTLELWVKTLTKAEFAKVKQQAKDDSRDLQAKLCVECQVRALRCLKASHGRSGCMTSFKRCTRDNGVAGRCRFDR